MSRSLRTSAAIVALVAGVALCMPVTIFARAHPTPSPTATPAPEDTTVTVIARREFVAWQAGVVNLDHYEPDSRAQITQQKITETSEGLGAAGSLNSIEWVGRLAIDDGPPGAKGYIYKMHCEMKDVYEELMIGSSGKVAGIIFKDSLQVTPPPTPTPFQTP